MTKAVVFTFAAFILSSCATSGIPPAHQAETRAPVAAASAPAAPSTARPRLLMSTLPGWERTEVAVASGAAAVFRNGEAGAVLTAHTFSAGDGTPDGVVSEFARRMTERGGVTVEVRLSEGGTYASLRWTGEHEGVPSRGMTAVRRPSGRSDLLLLMSGHWPATLERSFDEDVDLMFLLASAE